MGAVKEREKSEWKSWEILRFVFVLKCLVDERFYKQNDSHLAILESVWEHKRERERERERPFGNVVVDEVHPQP